MRAENQRYSNPGYTGTPVIPEREPVRDRHELVDSLYSIAMEIGARKDPASEVAFVIGSPNIADQYWDLKRGHLDFDMVPCLEETSGSMGHFPSSSPSDVEGFVERVANFARGDYRQCVICINPEGFISGVGVMPEIKRGRLDYFADEFGKHVRYSCVSDSDARDQLYMSALEVSLREPGLDIIMVNGKAVRLSDGMLMQRDRLKQENPSHAPENLETVAA